MKFSFLLIPSVLLIISSSPDVCADEIDAQLAVVTKVGAHGTGSRDAQQACRELANGGVAVLPRLLAALDTGNVVAANWLRTVYDQVVETELAKPSPQLPVALLKDYVRDSHRQGRLRRHVLATLDRVEPAFGREYVPSCLEDPEFRNDAVADAMLQGDQAKGQNQLEEAAAAYRKAFEHARESNQITTAADKLASVGQNVSIVEQMGLVIDWYVIGPFDAPDKSGFDLSFPPEQGFDLKAEYDGKDKARIHWKRHRSDDRLGQVNLVQTIAPVSEAVGYAYAELNANEDAPAQVRCGADDNLTVWLNGEKVFGRQQWLNGIRLDRFTAPVELKRGTNRLLVKVCQGPQHSNKDVANNWTLQIRICKPDGASAGLTSMLPAVGN